MKAYSINNKLLGIGSPTDSSGQSTPDGVTAFMITALPETAAPGGVYDLTDSNYYAITTDIYWKFVSSYAETTDPERRYDFQNMTMIYQFNSKNMVMGNYREFNVTLSTNLREGYDRNSQLLPIEDTFYPGVYLNSHYTTAGEQVFPIHEFINGPLSGNPTNVVSAGFHHWPDQECTEYYACKTWDGYPWHGVSFANESYSPLGWTKYKVIGDCSNGSISAFCAPTVGNYYYVGYTNMHTAITSVNGLYCYDYYDHERGTCSARNFSISGFSSFDDALNFSGHPRKILTY